LFEFPCGGGDRSGGPSRWRSTAPKARPGLSRSAGMSSSHAPDGRGGDATVNPRVALVNTFGRAGPRPSASFLAGRTRLTENWSRGCCPCVTIRSTVLVPSPARAHSSQQWGGGAALKLAETPVHQLPPFLTRVPGSVQEVADTFANTSPQREKSARLWPLSHPVRRESDSAPSGRQAQQGPARRALLRASRRLRVGIGNINALRPRFPAAGPRPRDVSPQPRTLEPH
jgi:hypothetical protein